MDQALVQFQNGVSCQVKWQEEGIQVYCVSYWQVLKLTVPSLLYIHLGDNYKQFVFASRMLYIFS